MTEAISKQSIETVAWLLLNAYSKHGKKKYLKDGIVNQKGN